MNTSESDLLNIKAHLEREIKEYNEKEVKFGYESFLNKLFDQRASKNSCVFDEDIFNGYIQYVKTKSKFYYLNKDILEIVNQDLEKYTDEYRNKYKKPNQDNK